MSVIKRFKDKFRGYRPLRVVTPITLNKEFGRIWDAIEEANGKPFANEGDKKPATKKVAKKSVKKETKAEPVTPVKKDGVKWEANK